MHVQTTELPKMLPNLLMNGASRTTYSWKPSRLTKFLLQPDFNGRDIHCHRELYTHCGKLPMGEKDRNFIIKLFRDAGRASVVSPGAAQKFVNFANLREDFKKGKPLVVQAIYRSFVRQVQIDEQLQEIWDFHSFKMG